MSDLQQNTPQSPAERAKMRTKAATPSKVVTPSKPGQRAVWQLPNRLSFRLFSDVTQAGTDRRPYIPHAGLKMWCWFRWNKHPDPESSKGPVDPKDPPEGDIGTSALLIWDDEFLSGVISTAGTKESVCSMFGTRMKDRVAAFKKTYGYPPFSITPQVIHVWDKGDVEV
jgi:hypothetical protein